MNNISPIGTITMMPATKAQINSFRDSVVTAVQNGDVDPLKLVIYLKSIEETVKAIREHYVVDEAIRDAAEQYPEKTIAIHGADVTKTQRTVYNFKECGDTVYNDLCADMDKTKAQIKAREEMLKLGENPETGEVYQKPVPITTSFLTIKLK